jgi:chromosome segregation ATPase
MFHATDFLQRDCAPSDVGNRCLVSHGWGFSMDHRWRVNHDVPAPGSRSAGPYQWQAWCQQLQQQLAATQHQTERAVTETRQRLEHDFQVRQEQWARRVDELESQLRQQQEGHQAQIGELCSQRDQAVQQATRAAEEIRSLKQELQHVASAAADEQRQLHDKQTALAEQHAAALRDKDRQLAQQRSELEAHSSEIERKQSEIEDYETAICQYETELEQSQGELERFESELTAWQVAHEQSVSLCEWHERQHQVSRIKIDSQEAAYEALRQDSFDAFAEYELQIETLEATVKLLQTDHEAVELINSELDSKIDEQQAVVMDLQTAITELQSTGFGLQATIAKLQQELASRRENAARDQQESRRSLEILRQTLIDTEQQLGVSQMENRSLTETIAQLKSAADERDAVLFAKDQQIDATQRAAEETRHQLDQLRKDHQRLSTENAQLRHRIDELSGEITELETDLESFRTNSDQANAKASEIAERLAEKETALKELTSAARAAEANALLELSEAEQRHAVEVERLETELAKRDTEVSHYSRQSSELQAEIDGLRDQVSVAEQHTNASIAEKDRLQQQIDQLQHQLGQAQQRVVESDQRVSSFETENAKLRGEAAVRGEQLEQLTREAKSRVTELTNYANQLAGLQAELVEKESQLETEISERWQARCEELEQANLRQRERHHQTQWSQQQTIDQLTGRLRSLESEKKRLAEQVAETSSRLDRLMAELKHWSQFAAPISEARRLTKAFADATARHAREREQLYGRIRQLQRAVLQDSNRSVEVVRAA